jgi:aminopeptidase-like protein
MIRELENYFDRLWPICRSITGKGLRESFGILQEIIPLRLTEVPSGTQVFDWQVPEEWNIRDAYIITPDGKKIADFRANNLHVVNYSTPVSAQLSHAELAEHVYTLPAQPDAIPYVTSYYKRNWGFCMPHSLFSKLPKEGKYKVHIDSDLHKGSLTYGDLVLPGESDREILFSSYLCHPSMANNELSGPLALAFLYKLIAGMKNRRFTYRFVLVPETIGAIAYLHKHGDRLKTHLHAGYVITCVGDRGPFTYKRSRRGDSAADAVAEHALRYSHKKYSVIDFMIGGSDERQYCSPGFNLPVGSLMRTMYQKFPEYHTSLDNKDFISFEALKDSVEMYFDIARAQELNRKFRNTIPHCEPNLGKRGLYGATGGTKERPFELTRRLQLLNFADGEQDLLAIAEKMNCAVFDLEEEVQRLIQHGLLSPI